MFCLSDLCSCWKGKWFKSETFKYSHCCNWFSCSSWGESLSYSSVFTSPTSCTKSSLLFFIYYFVLLESVRLMFQRKWYRNFLMKGFHVVVLLAAGPGIRDTQVAGLLNKLCFCLIWYSLTILPLTINGSSYFFCFV